MLLKGLFLLLTTAALLGPQGANPGDMQFSARVFDKGTYARTRLVAEGGLAPDAIAARVVLMKAMAGGREFESFDAGLSKMDTEVRRPDGRIITWIDFKLPKQKPSTVDLIEGELQVLAGGEDRELRVSGFRKKRTTKLSSAALKKAKVSLRASLTTEPVLRIAVVNGTGRVTGLSMEGTQVDYHASTGPERQHLVAHASKGRLPKGAVIVVEVTDASEKVHIIRLENLKASAKPQPVREQEFKALGVEVTFARSECHTLRVRAEAPEHELQDIQLASGDQELPWDSVMWTRTPTLLEIERTYASVPKSAELAVHLRQGAEWVGVPFSLHDLDLR